MCTVILGKRGRARVLSDMRGLKMGEYIPISPMGSEPIRVSEAVLSKLSQLRDSAKELAEALDGLTMQLASENDGSNRPYFDAANAALAKYKELTDG